MGAGASSAQDGGPDNFDAEIRALSHRRRTLSRTQIKHAAGRMLAARHGFATIRELAQHATTCSVGQRAALQDELNDLVAVVVKSGRRQRVPSESCISGGQQVCKCRTGACSCLCVYCGEQGHSSKLCQRRVEHAEPPEASRSWLGAARTVPSIAADELASRRVGADEPGAAPHMGDRLDQRIIHPALHDMTYAQQQRAAERLATHNTSQLRDELKAIPQCAALKRVNELVDAITWEAPQPDFWPTPSRVTAAKNAVAAAQATLTNHAISVGLEGVVAISQPVTASAGARRSITPEVVARLSQTPEWQQDDSKRSMPPRAHELLLESQIEYAALHSSAQEAWFEQYRGALGEFAPRHGVDQAGQAGTDMHAQLLEDQLRGVFADEMQQVELEEALSIWDSDRIVFDRTSDTAEGSGGTAPRESSKVRGKLSRQRSSNGSFRRSAARSVQAAIHQQNLVGEVPILPAAAHEERAKRQELADWLSKNQPSSSSTGVTPTSTLFQSHFN